MTPEQEAIAHLVATKDVEGLEALLQGALAEIKALKLLAENS